MTWVRLLKYVLVAAFCSSTLWMGCVHLPAGLLRGILAFGACVLSAVLLERPDASAPEDVTDQTVTSSRPTGRVRTLVVGGGEVGRQLATNLEASGRHEIVGFVDDELERIDTAQWVALGQRASTAALVREHRIDAVYVAYAPTWQQMLAEELSATCPHVALHIVPSPYEALLQIGRVENCGDIALVRMTTQATRVTDACKRLFDVLVASVVLVVFLPVFLAVSALIRLTSAGPIIFAQERIGRYGKPFRVYKFRTMVHNAEDRTGPVLSSGKSDARLTSLGRWLRLFRIDEIPQFWNVLRGEMSLVGPRPERPVFVQKFERMQPSYGRRHAVRPGITGLAQVCGGYHTDARDKLRFDLIYISHRSLWLDLTILLRTVLVVLVPDRQ